MRTPSSPPRLLTALPTLGVVLVLGLGLAGCGEGDPATSTAKRPITSASVTSSSASPSAPVDRAPTAVASSTLPTLPPGDPGPGPSVPEDTSGVEEPHGGAPRTDVPPGALLDAETVEAVVGGDWRIAAVPTGDCDAPRPTSPKPVATRSAALTGPGGLLMETVATHDDEDAARAIDALADRLVGCGWTLRKEPPLGEDSALLTRSSSASSLGAQQLAIVAAEGVTVTLLARGAASTNPDDWAALLDVAIGTSCLAASDGCH